MQTWYFQRAFTEVNNARHGYRHAGRCPFAIGKLVLSVMLGTQRVLRHDVTFRYNLFVANNRGQNKGQSFFITKSK
jgi:hypothetical protein